MLFLGVRFGLEPGRLGLFLRQVLNVFGAVRLVVLTLEAVLLSLLVDLSQMLLEFIQIYVIFVLADVPCSKFDYVRQKFAIVIGIDRCGVHIGF